MSEIERLMNDLREAKIDSRLIVKRLNGVRFYWNLSDDTPRDLDYWTDFTVSDEGVSRHDDCNDSNQPLIDDAPEERHYAVKTTIEALQNKVIDMCSDSTSLE